MVTATETKKVQIEIFRQDTPESNSILGKIRSELSS